MKKSRNHGLEGLRDDTERIEGYKKTEVGVIPDDWEVKIVGDICDFIVPGRNKPKKFEGDIPWITTPDLEDGKSVSKSRLGLCISRDEAKNVGSKIVPAGSVIMSCAGELGIVAFTDNEIVINQQLHAFIPSSIIDGLFLLNAIKAQKKYIDGVATKTAVPYINKDNCNSIPIPLPLLPEQKAIAQSLSDVDALITECDRIITKKRNTKQGTMQQLLTGKKRLPGFSGEWQHMPLGLLSAFITKGATPTTYGFKWEKEGVLFLRSECVGEYGIDLAQSMFIAPEAHNVLKRGEVRAGDILITITGNVGRVVHLDKSFGIANINQHIARIRVTDINVVAEYVFHFLSQSSLRHYYSLITTGQAYPQISLKQVRETTVPLPPPPEQKAIAQILSDMDAEIAALEQKRDKYKAIKQGMMQELLTGKTRQIGIY